MTKSPEQFNFSKKEDQDQFEALPNQAKEILIDASQSEAKELNKQKENEERAMALGDEEVSKMKEEIRHPSKAYLIMVDYENETMKEMRRHPSEIHPVILEANYSEMRYVVGGEGKNSDYRNAELEKSFNEIYDDITVDVEGGNGVVNLDDVAKGKKSTKDDFREFIREKIDGKNDLIEVLKEAEGNGLIRIIHIPAYYEDEQALREKMTK